MKFCYNRRIAGGATICRQIFGIFSNFPIVFLIFAQNTRWSLSPPDNTFMQKCCALSEKKIIFRWAFSKWMKLLWKKNQKWKNLKPQESKHNENLQNLRVFIMYIWNCGIILKTFTRRWGNRKIDRKAHFINYSKYNNDEYINKSGNKAWSLANFRDVRNCWSFFFVSIFLEILSFGK